MSKRRTRKPSYSHRHRAPSSDGWPLAIYEYLPRGPVRPRVPVLCCHGTNSRYAVFDAGAEFGLAPFLASRGFHVFAVDLRGRGLSGPRSLSRRMAAFFGRGWTLGDFLGKDLPAAFDFVLEHTGADQLDYIGHSMGGMLGLERLARTRDRRVRRLVTVGSGDAPAMLLPSGDGQDRPTGGSKVNVGMLLAPFALTARYSPVHWGGRLGAALLPLASENLRRRMLDPMLRSLLNPENLDPEVLGYFLGHGLSGISSRKFWSFGKLYRRSVKEADRTDRHHHPSLLIAGGDDRMVPPKRVRETASRATHPSTRVLEFSRAEGYSVDYGHLDLLLGRDAPCEVFPEIASWLSQDVRLESVSSLN